MATDLKQQYPAEAARQKYLAELPTCNFFDLFYPDGHEHQSNGKCAFWVRASDIGKLSAYLEIKPKVHALIRRMTKLQGGIVYATLPEHYYFEIVITDKHRTLYLKYQQIIGSRALCRIRNTDFDAVRRRINRATKDADKN